MVLKLYPGALEICFILNCKSHGNNYGFYGTGAYGQIDRCQAYNNDDYGMRVKITSVTNSIIYGNGTGIHSDNYGLQVLNCTVYNNTTYGVRAYGSGGIIYIHNSIVTSNGTNNLRSESTSTIMGDYNCTYDGSNSGYIAGANDITEDPDFVDAGNADFRPRNSAVLRGGRPDLAGNPTQMGAILQEYQFQTPGRIRVGNQGRLAVFR